MSFKVWLEAIDVPPHMPYRFFKEFQKTSHQLRNLLSQIINEHGFEKQYRELLGSYARNNLDDMMYAFTTVKRGLNDLIYGIDFIVDAIENDEMKSINAYQSFKRIPSDTFAKEIEEINLDSAWESLNKLEYEVNDASTDWREDWYGNYDEIVKNIKLSKQSLKELAKLKRWYPEFVRYIKAIVDSISRAEEKWFSGKEMLPSHEDIEVLYHATTNVSAILSSGFKTRLELTTKGLGGGPDNLISFTSDIRIAEGIVWALRRAVEIAKGKLGLKQLQILAKSVNVSWNEVIQSVKVTTGDSDYETKTYELENFKGLGKRPKTEEEKRAWLFHAFQIILIHQNKYYNPLFFGVNVKDLETINIRDIGIVAAEVDMTQVQQYLASMEEYRVPKGAIYKIWRVAYKGATRLFA